MSGKIVPFRKPRLGFRGVGIYGDCVDCGQVFFRRKDDKWEDGDGGVFTACPACVPFEQWLFIIQRHKREFVCLSAGRDEAHALVRAQEQIDALVGLPVGSLVSYVVVNKMRFRERDNDISRTGLTISCDGEFLHHQ